MTDLFEVDALSAVRPFLRGAEVWAPAPDRDELMFVTGSYGGLEGFEAVSHASRFAYGEGLPGAAWAQRRPIVMPTGHPAFLRSTAAADAGITCAIAVPVFVGDFLTGVVVFLCGGDDTAGAIEVWRPGGADGDAMVLADGYFGNLDAFERTARQSAFAKGVGLPGQVWETDMPVVMGRLGRERRFVRSAAAAAAGFTVGLGMPVVADADDPYVVTFLSALGTPIARWIEVWVPDELGMALRFESGYSDEGADLAARYEGARVLTRHGPLGRVYFSGVPLVTDYAGLDGSTGMIALPVIRDGVCRAVVALIS